MRPSRRNALCAVVAGALLVGGCSSSGSSSADGVPVTPALADVTPIADPASWTGATSARIANTAIDPITTGEQTLPAEVVDAQGTAVTVTDTSRILALDLYGSLSRTVFELGFGDSVVGRDISSGFDEIADRPLVTEGGHDLNAEAILGLSPTLIITDTTLGPWDVILQMRDAGVPVVVLDSKRSLETVGPLVDGVASALGVPERGTELSERLAAEISDTTARIADVAPAEGDRLRMVFLYVRGQAGVYYLFGEGSGADSLITSLGGVDVAGEIGWQGMRPVTDEGIIAADPDLLLVMTGGLESVGGVDGLLDSIPALALTTAGENKRVVDMPDNQILSFGPMSARVLEALAVAVYAPQEAG